MNKTLLLVCACGLVPTNAFAGDPPANAELAVEESFAGTELGSEWHTTTGDWRIVDGVLRGREIPADEHSAATRRVVATGNAVYDLRFRFVGEGEAFHFGFDPVRGALDKRGHLFSVVVTPASWKVLKHVDKARPKEDPNEVLAERRTTFERGTWYALRVTTWSRYVTAHVDGKEPLKASHPTFGVGKPTLVFRCVGDGVEIDDLRVWKQRQK